jgi:hypothetical protein
VRKLDIELLYDRYAGAIYGACLSFTNDPLLAQQALVNTFCHATHGDANTGKTTLLTLLYQQARKECLLLMKEENLDSSLPLVSPLQRVVNELTNRRGYCNEK